jgi:uncharacterized DUF497 family protein
LRFEWDPWKAAANQAEHKVSIDEGVMVFGVRSRHTRDSRTLGPIGLGTALPQRTPH